MANNKTSDIEENYFIKDENIPAMWQYVMNISKNLSIYQKKTTDKATLSGIYPHRRLLFINLATRLSNGTSSYVGPLNPAVRI